MATVNYIGDGGPDGTEFRGTMTISGTTTVSGSFSTTGTSKLGDAAADLVAFHDAPAVDQAALVTLETTVSASVIASRVKSIIALLIEKGLMASA
jgi:hypothetical protein